MADTQLYHEESPPFAMVESHPPQHLFEKSTPTTSHSVNVAKSSIPNKLLNLSDSQMSSNSPAPGLVESVMTDGSSSSPSDSEYLSQGGAASYCISPSSNHHLLTESLPTVSSEIGGSSLLPSSRVFGQHEVEGGGGGASAAGSVGFSQLLRAADDANLQFGHSRMPIVPEDDTVHESDYVMQSGTLISSPDGSVEEHALQAQNNGWLPSFLSLVTASPAEKEGLREPLIPSGGAPQLNQSILGASPYDIALTKAKTTISSVLEDDQSFEVTMDMCADLSVQDVLNVLGNPDLLKLWCDPIQSLIVTSASDDSRESSTHTEANRGREYEGEWIEATTTALESPASATGFLFGVGESVRQTLGFASYGRITMFVERKRGQVGLTVGPFQGGVHAAHTITVAEENGMVRLTDRVRLTHEEDEVTLASMFLCGALGSCLGACLLPPLGSYVDQVKTSLGRLRLLVENENRAPGGAVITGGTLVSVPVR